MNDVSPCQRVLEPLNCPFWPPIGKSPLILPSWLKEGDGQVCQPAVQQLWTLYPGNRRRICFKRIVIKNYLNDQLLGFALVQLSEIFDKNGTLENEYELLSNELMHSSCGFFKLSIVYTGSQPEVLDIMNHNPCLRDRDEVCNELEKIEFPDPKLMNENEFMVSEYYSQSQPTEKRRFPYAAFLSLFLDGKEKKRKETKYLLCS
ncbi:hypothetical protein Tco_1062473 [Tanacetum coccineum]